ncbi:30S ribosomal protein S17 [Legionella sp. W05-934-2]|jgi:small subunit ribosomal protein S17|uniref:30S ribosomal protein S17 n=1 Tax=Legionella sp. W05-934-2 TaxID=1198649 RepID=UPI0034629394
MVKAAESSSRARTVIGKVVSNKMDKTIVVLVERLVKHPFYGKYVRRTTKLSAHDEKGIAQEGNTVKIQETRPIAKNKSWVLIEVLS